MYDYNYGYDYAGPALESTGVDMGDLTSILGGLAAFSLIVALLSIAVVVLVIISNWKLFEKAKRNGWESLVPVHNIFVLLEIGGTPTWHIFLFFLPIANIYALFKMCIDLAHKFGKSTGFGVATALFPWVCFPILGFSKKVKYNQEDHEEQEKDNTNDTQQPMNNVMPTPEPMNPQQNQNIVEPSTNPQQPINEMSTNFADNNMNQIQNNYNQPMTQQPMNNVMPTPEPMNPQQTQNIVEPAMNPQQPINQMPVQNNNNQTGTMM